MSDNLLSSLNSVQQEAVQHTEGPLLILSGAGSGKTRVITHRVAYLIKHHRVSPFRILAVTFTNKAANEMKERLDGLVGERMSKNLWVATFHATCAHILRQDIEKLKGYTRAFTIFDTSKQIILVKDVLRQLGLDPKQYKSNTILSYISRAKNGILTSEIFEDTKEGHLENIVAKVQPIYQRELRRNNALDFDDLLLLTVKLFKQFPDVLKNYQKKFEYVLVDEYQDTNQCQHELICLLSGTKQNICVVGDDDQSIYSFRGATIENILNFEKDFPNTRVLRLEQNYRSTQNILNAAWSVVQNNSQRRDKKLWTKNKKGKLLIYYEAVDENDEVGYVISQIENRQERDIAYSDCAVFYRTNAQSRIFEAALRTANVPYQIVGGVGFYERMEIKDLLAYLSVMCNPDDSVSLRRIINVPTRGIGATTLERLRDFAEKKEISLFDAVQRVGEITQINRGLQTKVRRFTKIFEDFGREDLPSEALDHVLKTTSYLKNLEAQKTIEAQARVENIKELINAIAEYEFNEPEPTLADYLETIALIADVDTMETDDKVSLMTLHAAKGLEFSLVFIVGMEEGFMPHKSSTLDQENLEEERRLCYVGITRAMKQIYLISAESRRTYSGVEYRSPSRFISEIPDDLIETINRYHSPFSETESIDSVEVPFSETESIDSVEEQTLNYKVNQIVEHPKFGKGIITQINRTNQETFVTVQFSRVGTKLFAATVAPWQAV